MIEDKLTREERIRLECLAQANSGAAMGRSRSTSDILAQAAKFERFVLWGNSEEGSNA